MEWRLLFIKLSKKVKSRTLFSKNIILFYKYQGRLFTVLVYDSVVK